MGLGKTYIHRRHDSLLLRDLLSHNGFSGLLLLKIGVCLALFVEGANSLLARSLPTQTHDMNQFDWNVYLP